MKDETYILVTSEIKELAKERWKTTDDIVLDTLSPLSLVDVFNKYDYEMYYGSSAEDCVIYTLLELARSMFDVYLPDEEPDPDEHNDTTVDVWWAIQDIAESVQKIINVEYLKYRR